jgi:hypothetical protein
MSLLRSYFLGLIVAHLAWLFFFTTGQLLWKRHSDTPKPVRLDTLVITSVAGIALSGFRIVIAGICAFVEWIRARGPFIIVRRLLLAAET